MAYFLYLCRQDFIITNHKLVKMKRIKLQIREFGRIKKSEIELTPWMIFSGESGMGKSYLAILVHYFFDVLLSRETMDSFFREKGFNYNDMLPNLRSNGDVFVIEKLELEEWLAKKAVEYVSYMINDKKLKADFSIILPEEIPTSIKCRFEEEIMGMDNNEEVYLKFYLPSLTYRTKNSPVGLNEESPFAFFFRFYLMNIILGDYKALEHTFVLPPSRGAAMTESVVYKTGLFKEFLNDKQFLESAKINNKSTPQILIDLMTDVMEGKVGLVDNQYRYQLSSATDGDDMPLTAAASSIRELAPIQMMIDNVNIKTVAILFEEPEAHLHPAKQRMMADVISCMSRAGTFMQITTHSDYLLRRLNELIALQMIKDKSSNIYNEIAQAMYISEDVLPDLNNLSAFILERQNDGSSKIVRQDLSKGIPYSTFYGPLKESIENKSKIIAAIKEMNDETD